MWLAEQLLDHGKSTLELFLRLEVFIDPFLGDVLVVLIMLPS
jgi:hypothetical protein